MLNATIDTLARVVLTFAVFLAIAACARTPEPPLPVARPEASQGTGGAKPARVGEAFGLHIGETAAMASESLTVSFEAVVEDSRCGPNATCVWAGTAVIRLGLRGANGERGALTLQTLSEAGREGTFQKYRLRLIELDPPPKDSGPIPSEQYLATLTVRHTE